MTEIPDTLAQVSGRIPHRSSKSQIFEEATGESWPLQLKATNDVSYVHDWVEDHPDGEIQVTDELAEKLGLDQIGIENEDLTVRTQDVVDQIIAYGEPPSLASYFPPLSVASVALIVYSLWRRYQKGEISYSRFKMLAGMATGLKVSKIAALMAVMSVPILNIPVGAYLLAQLIDGTTEFASEKLDQVRVNDRVMPQPS